MNAVVGLPRAIRVSSLSATNSRLGGARPSDDDNARAGLACGRGVVVIVVVIVVW